MTVLTSGLSILFVAAISSLGILGFGSIALGVFREGFK